MDLKEFCQKYINKSSNAIVLSKDPEIVSLRNELLSKTSFLDPAHPSWKIRMIAVLEEWDDIPRCHFCNEPTRINSGRNTVNKYCSLECRTKGEKHRQLSDEAVKLLTNREWLWEHRIDRRMSYEAIASLAGTTETAVKNWCARHKIPKLRYNESNPEVMSLLRDREWWKENYVNSKKSLGDLSEELGVSVSTLSVWLRKNGIEAKPTNSYPRKFKRISEVEKKLTERLVEDGVLVQTCNRSILDGMEVDLVLNDRLCVEVNGLYYHSEIFKDKMYHYNKKKIAKERGYDLIHLYDDQLSDKFDLCISMIRARLGICKRIYARDCTVTEIPTHEKNLFLDLNHIQGRDSSQIKIGLVHNDQIVSVMTFTQSRFNKNYDWELSRFCSVRDHIVVGGASKLLSYFRKRYSGSIISYSDNDISDGNLYQALGFQLLNESIPGMFYTDCCRRWSRSTLQKWRLKDWPEYDDSLPEREILAKRGIIRIWTSGTKTWILI